MTTHAGVARPPCKFVILRLANLLRQRPEAIAFLEWALEPGRTGKADITINIKEGKMLAWSYQPAGKKRIDPAPPQAVK